MGCDRRMEFIVWNRNMRTEHMLVLIVNQDQETHLIEL